MRSHPKKLLIIALLAVSVLLVSNVSNTLFNKASASTPPAGFQETTVTGGLTAPVAFAFAPDGRIFITEKGGKIRVVKNGALLSQPFATITVDSSFERGLLGIAFDPEFATNRYVYVYYTRTTPSVRNKISRFTASATNPDVVETGSETVILDNIPSESGNHNGGAIHFGTDGKLYVAIGDSGNTAYAQNLNVLAGKFLRINKDGTIPSDNPFVGQTGRRAEIWAYGLRNPFTFAVNPTDGTINVNDVGQDTWEEVNRIQKGGNYGWPTCEGVCSNSAFINPIATYNHSTGRSISGGTFYTGSQFPSQYSGKYFFGDYVNNFIKYLDGQNAIVHYASNTGGIVDLAMGPDGSLYYVSITTGTLYKISYGNPNITPTPTPAIPAGNGLIGRYFNNLTLSGTPINRIDGTIDFFWSNGGPIPGIASDNFSARWSGSVMPEHSETYTFSAKVNDGVRVWVNNQLLIDQWQDRTTATEFSGTIALTGGQKYPIKVEYYDKTGDAEAQLYWNSISQPKQIIPVSRLFTAIGQLPVATINTPVETAKYNAGNVISYSGTGTDGEDGTLPASVYKWDVVFHHDTHTHPFLDNIGGVNEGTFTIPTTGEPAANTWYRIFLTVTDSDGQTTTATRDINPNKANLTFTTQPAGLSVNVDGQPKTTPYTAEGVVGFVRDITTPNQVFNGRNYQFASWSDAGLQNHSITTPGTETTYTATFTDVGPAAQSNITIRAAGTPSGGIYPTMDLLINDQVVKSYPNIQGNAANRVFQTFTYTHPTLIGARDIKMRFSNDGSTATEDRNLRIDNLAINGRTYETEGPDAYSTGTWNSATGCAAGNKNSEWLQCPGYFTFPNIGPVQPTIAQPTPTPTRTPTPTPTRTPTPTIPQSTGSTVTIYAAGQPAGGIYPTIDLLINNVIVRSFANVQGNTSTRVFVPLSYTHPSSVSRAQVRVRYNNDGSVNGQDRNVLIDRITIGATTYQTEAPTIYSVGSWNSSTGCNGGYKSSEWLHCNGYFQY